MKGLKNHNFWQDSRWKMYGTSGVYCICTRGHNIRKGSFEPLKIWYVGSAKDIGKRLSSSKHPLWTVWNDTGMLPFVRFMITSDYVHLEKRLIRLMNPILNKIGKKKISL